VLTSPRSFSNSRFQAHIRATIFQGIVLAGFNVVDLERLSGKDGPLERCGALWVQRVGLPLHEAGELLAATTSHGNIPDPLRLAHIIASDVERGASRGRP
jgi:endonuclease V-like protein UPF0215 family